MILKNVFAENFGGFLPKLQLVREKNWIITLDFKKNANVSENSGHNIEPNFLKSSINCMTSSLTKINNQTPVITVVKNPVTSRWCC
jgi:hypothetical protein